MGGLFPDSWEKKSFYPTITNYYRIRRIFMLCHRPNESSKNNFKVCENLLWKESWNSDIQQFRQYQQNKRSLLVSNHRT